jgi:hypothetical protein
MKLVWQKSRSLFGLLALISLFALAQLPAAPGMAGMAHAGMAHAGTTAPVDAKMLEHEDSDNCCQGLIPESCALQGMGHCTAGGVALFAVADGWSKKSGPGPNAPYRGFQPVAPPPASDPPPPRI